MTDEESKLLLDCFSRICSPGDCSCAMEQKDYDALVKRVSNATTQCHGASLAFRYMTPRQWQVVHLVADGEKNRDIGRMVGLTENMVKNYLREIFDRTGMNTRLELALWYLARGKELERCQLPTISTKPRT